MLCGKPTQKPIQARGGFPQSAEFYPSRIGVSHNSKAIRAQMVPPPADIRRASSIIKAT